jgi:hypothetical protein
MKQANISTYFVLFTLALILSWRADDVTTPNGSASSGMHGQGMLHGLEMKGVEATLVVTLTAPDIAGLGGLQQ